MNYLIAASGHLSRLLFILREKSPSGAVARLASLALIFGAVCAFTAAQLAPGGALAAGALFTAVALTAIRGAIACYPHPHLGLCNTVTLFRAGLTCALIAPLVVPGPPTQSTAWLVTAIATLAFLLDGVDGWFARRSGLSSVFGARFDMEVDAALGLILSLLVIDAGKLGIWVLALGGMRYAFVAASVALPWLGAPLPDRFRRKAICVVQVATLIILTVPGVSGIPAAILALAAIFTLTWSFARDILWLARRRSA